jgi:hypothetical protein
MKIYVTFPKKNNNIYAEFQSLVNDWDKNIM